MTSSFCASGTHAVAAILALTLLWGCVLRGCEASADTFAFTIRCCQYLEAAIVSVVVDRANNYIYSKLLRTVYVAGAVSRYGVLRRP